MIKYCFFLFLSTFCLHIKANLVANLADLYLLLREQIHLLLIISSYGRIDDIPCVKFVQSRITKVFALINLCLVSKVV